MGNIPQKKGREWILAQEYFKAIKGGQFEKVQTMIERNRNLVSARDDAGMSGVVIASYYGQPSIASLLISNGAQLDVFEAAMVGDLGTLRKLVEQDRNRVRAYSPDGFTALHFAAFFGHFDSARFLIESGADPSAVAKNMMKVTPLHSAAAHNHLEISKLLVSKGADVNARQENNFTPLHAAAQNGNVALAKFLLERGARPDAKTMDQKTPLDLTKMEGPEAGSKEDREAVAKLLLLGDK